MFLPPCCRRFDEARTDEPCSRFIDMVHLCAVGWEGIHIRCLRWIPLTRQEDHSLLPEIGVQILVGLRDLLLTARRGPSQLAGHEIADSIDTESGGLDVQEGQSGSPTQHVRGGTGILLTHRVDDLDAGLHLSLLILKHV